MSNYGNSKDRWTITDGRVRFDLHQQINGSVSSDKESVYIVTPEQATAYAHKILAALIAADVWVD